MNGSVIIVSNYEAPRQCREEIMFKGFFSLAKKTLTTSFKSTFFSFF